MSKQDSTTGVNAFYPYACYYYLHTNGDIIHKSINYDPSGFEESDFVICWWKINLKLRKDAYLMLIRAKMLGAKEERINELIAHWGITNDDAKNFVDNVGLKWFMDGNAYFVVEPDFVNIQESDAGSGDTLFNAIAEFFRLKVES